MKIFLTKCLAIFGGVAMIAIAFLAMSIKRKEVEITGFGYKGDLIKVSQPYWFSHEYRVKDLNQGSRGVCGIYMKVTCYGLGGRTLLMLKFDSGSRGLVDTVVLFTEKNPKPIATFFINASGSKDQRKLLIRDRTDHGNIEL